MGEEAPKIVPEEITRPPKKEPGLRVVEGPVEPVVGAEAKEPPKRGRFPLWGKILTSLGIAGMVGGGMEAADQQGVLPEPFNKTYDTGKKVVQEVGQDIARATDGALEKLGVDIIKTDQEVQEIRAGVAGKANLSQTSQESPTVTQTETQEQEKVKKFEGIKVEIVTDPSFEYLDEMINENLDLKMGYKAPPVKEVVFKNPEKGPKMLEKALLLTWAYALKIRMDPDLKEIPNENTDLLISTLIKKYEAGEDLTFDINISTDNRNAYYINETRSMHKVDFSKGVTIEFVGEINEERLPTHQTNYGSRDFFPITLAEFKDGSSHVGIGAKLEVSDDGKLTISSYALNDSSETQTSTIASISEAIITQEYYGGSNTIYRRYLCDSLFVGNRYEGDKWVEYGEPALEVIYEK